MMVPIRSTEFLAVAQHVAPSDPSGLARVAILCGAFDVAAYDFGTSCGVTNHSTRLYPLPQPRLGHRGHLLNQIVIVLFKRRPYLHLNRKLAARSTKPYFLHKHALLAQLRLKMIA